MKNRKFQRFTTKVRFENESEAGGKSVFRRYLNFKAKHDIDKHLVWMDEIPSGLVATLRIKRLVRKYHWQIDGGSNEKL